MRDYLLCESVSPLASASRTQELLIEEVEVNLKMTCFWWGSGRLVNMATQPTRSLYLAIIDAILDDLSFIQVSCCRADICCRHRFRDWSVANEIRS